MKIAVYMFWNILFILFSLFWGSAILADNKMDESCHIVSKDTSGSFFHWIWEGQFCRFDFMYMISFYIIVLLVYSLFKGYGYKQKKYVIFPQFVISELFGYFLVYYILLLTKVADSGIKINFNILFNSLIGCLQFFIPIILYGSLIGWIGYKEKQDKG